MFESEIFLWSLIVLVGLSWGSFLNVVMVRLPFMLGLIKSNLIGSRRINLFTPRSMCMMCGHKLTIIENIPLLSYIIQKGKCKNCTLRLPKRYPLIEILTTIMGFILYYKYDITLTFVFFMLFFSIGLIITFIDLDHYIIPNVLVYILLIIGILFSILTSHIRIFESILGVGMGYLIFSVMGYIATYFYKRTVIGKGDYKLFSALGAWLGVKHLLLSLMISCIIGSLICVVLLLNKKLHLKDKVPFGPFLILGSGVVIIYPSYIYYIYRVIFFW